jgi:hypothetical protein
MQEVERLITIWKDHNVWMMEVIPCFLLKACCQVGSRRDYQ